MIFVNFSEFVNPTFFYQNPQKTLLCCGLVCIGRSSKDFKTLEYFVRTCIRSKAVCCISGFSSWKKKYNNYAIYNLKKFQIKFPKINFKKLNYAIKIKCTFETPSSVHTMHAIWFMSLSFPRKPSFFNTVLWHFQIIILHCHIMIGLGGDRSDGTRDPL